VRNTFGEVLYGLAKDDPRVHIVVSDISPVGSMAKFREEFPERFINVGVAEQSMIGICAGLALKGMLPFAYTIATFSLFRPYARRHPLRPGRHCDRRVDPEHVDHRAVRSG
jgi:transketolase